MASDDGGYNVIRIEELEEQVSEKRWQNTLRSMGRSSKLVMKNREDSNAGPSRSASYSLSRIEKYQMEPTIGTIVA